MHECGWSVDVCASVVGGVGKCVYVYVVPSKCECLRVRPCVSVYV